MTVKGIPNDELTLEIRRTRGSLSCRELLRCFATVSRSLNGLLPSRLGACLAFGLTTSSPWSNDSNIVKDAMESISPASAPSVSFSCLFGDTNLVSRRRLGSCRAMTDRPPTGILLAGVCLMLTAPLVRSRFPCDKCVLNVSFYKQVRDGSPPRPRLGLSFQVGHHRGPGRGQELHPPAVCGSCTST